MSTYATTHFVRWVRTDEVQPTDEGEYLIFAPSADPTCPLMVTGWWDPETKGFRINPHWASAITHWALLPAPPEAA